MNLSLNLFKSVNRRDSETKSSDLRVARRARGAEGVVAAADFDGHSGGQVDLGAVQFVGMCLLKVFK